MTSPYRSAPDLPTDQLIHNNHVCPNCELSIERLWDKYADAPCYRGNWNPCSGDKCGISVAHQHVKCFACKLTWIKLI